MLNQFDLVIALLVVNAVRVTEGAEAIRSKIGCRKIVSRGPEWSLRVVSDFLVVLAERCRVGRVPRHPQCNLAITKGPSLERRV